MVSLSVETSRVDPRARLADDVIVGPGCVIGPDVEIGRGTHLVGHVSLTGSITLGEFNTIGLYTAIGGEPQDVSYGGSPTRVEIGDHNTIFDHVSIHRASEKEGRVTRIGSHNRLLTGAHVAHDCQLGDGITLGHGSLLAGHVHVESRVVIAEKTAVLQFVTCGNDSVIGDLAKISQDVPPYMVVDGNPTTIRGVNPRCGMPGRPGDEMRASLQEAYQRLFRDKMPLEQAIEELEAHDHLTLEVVYLLKFLEAQHEGRQGRARDRRAVK